MIRSRKTTNETHSGEEVVDSGQPKDMYRSTTNDSNGKDNFGHDIPELFTITNEFIAQTTQQNIVNSPPDPLTTDTATGTVKTFPRDSSSLAATRNSVGKMTPLIPESLLGRKTSHIIDITVVLILTIWLILTEAGLFPHIKRGFYCDDRSIAFKFQGDTISTGLILLSILVPFIILWLTEAIFFKPISIKSTRFKRSCIEALYWFKYYSVGMVLHLTLVELMKVLVGELRPHFLDTCKPDAAFNCTGSTYISTYTCTNTQIRRFLLYDASKSFPSGHSSISFFEAVFLIWYFQRRIPYTRSVLLVPILQVLCVFWGLLCSISRITDHRHHWWDVLTGVILGILFASLTCIFLCKNFKRKPYEQDSICQNGHHSIVNGSSGGNTDHRHTSVRRLLSDSSCKDEVTMNRVVVA